MVHGNETEEHDERERQHPRQDGEDEGDLGSEMIALGTLLSGLCGPLRAPLCRGGVLGRPRGHAGVRRHRPARGAARGPRRGEAFPRRRRGGGKMVV